MPTRNVNVILLLTFFIITIGQFACAVYLPSMPAMQTALHTDNDHIQLTYTWLLAAYGLSMLFYGPLSDSIGRKRVLFIGMSIYLLGSLLTVFIHDIQWLLAGRVLQGLGLGSAAVSRAINKDVFDGSKFVKTSAFISMGIAVTPIVAQIIGGYIEHYIGWHGNFAFMLIYGLVIVAIVGFKMPETNHRMTHRFNLREIFMDYKMVLSHSTFVGLLLCTALVFSGEMVFNVIAPFLLQRHLGVSSVTYGWLSLFLLVGFLAGSYLTSFLADRVSVCLLIILGLVILLFSCVLMLLLSVSFNVWVIMIPIMFYMFGNSLVLINAGAAGLLIFPQRAGTAGALQSGVMLLGSGIISSFASGIQVHTQKPLAIALTGFGLLTAVAFYFLVWRGRPKCLQTAKK